ncbi:MAG: hypothetical protein R3B70_04300 [Polyangiaceae bacterium]
MSDTEPRDQDEEPMPSDPAPPSGDGEPDFDPEGEDGLDDVDVRDLLRAALEPPPQKSQEETALLKGVQRRLRQRSKGKFYADGWSTSRSPRSTYLLTSIFMLLLIAFVFLVLMPWSNTALP